MTVMLEGRYPDAYLAAAAHAVVPGRQNIPLWLTIGLGIVGP